MASNQEADNQHLLIHQQAITWQDEIMEDIINLEAFILKYEDECREAKKILKEKKMLMTQAVNHVTCCNKKK
jgi:hypothetical protein